MPSPANVLALFAHPDDAEFLCAGTLAHLAERGASVHIVTMTAGDCGSTILPAAKIARIRRNEAARAAKLMGAEYSCLEESFSVQNDVRHFIRLEKMNSQTADI